MQLYDAIVLIYPALMPGDFVGNVVLRDTGKGAFIDVWNYPHPRPTGAQLLAYGVVEGQR